MTHWEGRSTSQHASHDDGVAFRATWRIATAYSDHVTGARSSYVSSCLYPTVFSCGCLARCWNSTWRTIRSYISAKYRDPPKSQYVFPPTETCKSNNASKHARSRFQCSRTTHGTHPRVPPRNNGPPGKAPSRGEQNDYSQNFVDTGMRPQNFIRELELTSVVEDYPKLRELIQKKDEIVANSASAPMYYKCDLREQVLSPEFFGTKFDVILVDPPWDEYVHRAPGVADHMEYWTFEEIMNLKIEVAIADTPSFVFLWVGDGVGLEQGRQCLKKWDSVGVKIYVG
ncbi:putative mRNA (2'-O-methyladenosine-N(6)-)-methyltransferase [Helianthus annuus]|nr:putative mRNA (2'-O-methyladenosine-N(6)-)-methyltransferase [Helianthus annuus]